MKVFFLYPIKILFHYQGILKKIIISGKNGNISLAVDGVILENIHFNDLENKLRKIFIDDNSKKMGISNYFRIGQ